MGFLVDTLTVKGTRQSRARYSGWVNETGYLLRVSICLSTHSVLLRLAKTLEEVPQTLASLAHNDALVGAS